jgi:hypothetical protein
MRQLIIEHTKNAGCTVGHPLASPGFDGQRSEFLVTGIPPDASDAQVVQLVARIAPAGEHGKGPYELRYSDLWRGPAARR